MHQINVLRKIDKQKDKQITHCSKSYITDTDQLHHR